MPYDEWEMRARIVLQQLPPRPRQLEPAEVSAIFGGCKQFMEVCEEDCACCVGLTCSGHSPQTGLMYCIEFK
jgi:hypothetical protein